MRISNEYIVHKNKVLISQTDAKDIISDNFLLFESESLFSESFFKIGEIEGLERFLCSRRISVCWMAPETGVSVSEVPVETQFFLCKLKSNEYLMIIPMIDKRMRCAIFGKEDGLYLHVMSGCSKIKTKQIDGVYVDIGNDPYELIEKAAERIVEKTETCQLRRNKKLPEYVQYYGWCTYNAMYDDISHEKIMDIIGDFQKNEVVPGFVLIDAGWQSICDKKLAAFYADPNKLPDGLQALVKDLKKSNVKNVLVWHTYNGYWYGIDNNTLTNYKTKDIYANFNDFILSSTQQCSEKDNVATAGKSFYPMFFADNAIAMVEADFFRLYYDYYNYLRTQGVDGTKIDAMAWAECYGEDYAGSTEIMRLLVSSVEGASNTHFDGNLLNCSGSSNAFIFQSVTANLTRTSRDFFPDIPATHGWHIYTNAVNSYWMGEFLHPDWDMFQSGHEAGEMHAMSRAISGGPVYSTDSMGEENYNIIKKLSFKDGTVPLCGYYARICLDSMFFNPLKDMEIIKIFNFNKYGAVIGAFNCRYDSDKNIIIKYKVCPNDVYKIQGNTFAVFAHKQNRIWVLKRAECIFNELGRFEAEIYTVMPIISGFAAIGLSEMYNSGGTINNIFIDGSEATVSLHNSGLFVAYCMKKPVAVYEGGKNVEFDYDSMEYKLIVNATSCQITIKLY